MTDFDAKHVQVKIDDKAVLMRKEDGFLNATQIISLAKKSESERGHILRLLERKTKVEMLLSIKGIGHVTSWVNFQHGRILCKDFGLEENLQPLIEYYESRFPSDYGRTADQVDDYVTKV